MPPKILRAIGKQKSSQSTYCQGLTQDFQRILGSDRFNNILRIGNWELGIGHWELGIGNWAIINSSSSLLPHALCPMPYAPIYYVKAATDTLPAMVKAIAVNAFAEAESG